MFGLSYPGQSYPGGYPVTIEVLDNEGRILYLLANRSAAPSLLASATVHTMAASVAAHSHAASKAAHVFTASKAGHDYTGS